MRPRSKRLLQRAALVLFFASSSAAASAQPAEDVGASSATQKETTPPGGSSLQTPSSADDVVTRPRPLHYPSAVAPTDAQLKAPGTVVVLVTINASGAVDKAVLVQRLAPRLDEAALAAISRWRFAPATRNGEPIASKIRVPFEFAPAIDSDPVTAATEGSPSGMPRGSARKSSEVPSGPTHQHEREVVPHPQGATSSPELAASNPGADFPHETNVVVDGRRVERSEQRSSSDFRIQHDVLEAAPRHEGVEVLRSAPGMYIARPAGAAVAHRYMLRGFDSEHGQDIEFRVAGLPINLPSHIHGQGYADLGFLIAETVDELRVTEGVHDPRQGDFAVAGSIDVKLGVAERGTRVRSSYGSFNTFRQLLLWAPKSQLRDSFGAVSFQHTDGFGENRRGQTVSSVVQQGFGLDEWRTQFVGIFYGARADMAGVLRRDDIQSGRVGFLDVYPLATARAQNAQASRALLGLSSRYSGESGETLELGFWLGYDRFRIQQNFTGFVERSESLPGVAGRGDLIEQRNRTASLGMSANYRTSTYRLSKWFEGYLELGGMGRIDSIDQAQNLLDAAVRLQTWDERVDAQIGALDVGLWADLDFHLTENLLVRLGARVSALSYEIDDQLGNRAAATRPQDQFIRGFRRSAFGVAAGPRASLDLHATQWLTLHASYGEGYRSPQARTLVDGERTPFTKVRSADIGARMSWNNYQLILSGYRTDLSDDVAFEAREGRLERVGQTRRMGGVLQLEARPWPGIVAAGSITFVDAELLEPPIATQENPTPAFEPGQNLPFVPPVVARLDVGAEHTLIDNLQGMPLDGRVGLGFSALSARPLPFGEFADPLNVIDASLAFTWSALELGVEVYNVTDSRYAAAEFSIVSSWDPQSTPSRLPERHIATGSPRTVMGTVTLKL